MSLWTPNNDNQQGHMTVPLRDITLGNGRRLRYRGLVGMPVAGIVGQAASYAQQQLSVLASIDVTDRWGPLLHCSLARPDRDPTWEEIRLIKDAFFGDTVDAMMLLPRAEDDVNVHQHAFHLWQCPKGWHIQ